MDLYFNLSLCLRLRLWSGWRKGFEGSDFSDEEGLGWGSCSDFSRLSFPPNWLEADAPATGFYCSEIDCLRAATPAAAEPGAG